MLRTRLWTAIVALPVTIAVVLFAPVPVFTAVIAILTAWGLYEIIAMTGANGFEALFIVVVGGFFAVGSRVSALSTILVTIEMLALVAAVGRKGAEQSSKRPWSRPALLFLGASWIGAFFPYLALLRNHPGGIPIITLLVLLVVASDSGAYFVGRSLGRTRLLPRVSPNKTVEGAIGGLAACVIAATALRSLLAPRWTTIAVVIMAAVVGVLAQFGDAVGSAFKRVAGVKDSGWIFPGHGGLIDRICSLVFAAAFTYYYLVR